MYIQMIPSTQVRNDVETIVETHRLAGTHREMLVRIVTGTVPGNRDLPLYRLAKSILTLVSSGGGCEAKLFDLIGGSAGGAAQMPRIALALLDFLATMDNYCHFYDIERAVAGISARCGQRELASAAGIFASCLHRYRVSHLPYEARRQAFSSIRKHFENPRPGVKHPEDAGAIEFWVSVASSDSWTTYSATLSALVDYADAAAMRRSSAELSLDALEDNGLNASSSVFDTIEADGSELWDAHDILASANLKVFKGPDLDEIRRFATALPALRRWRRAGLAVLCFGPVQNVLVQMKRQAGSSDEMAIVAACDGARSYTEQICVLSEIEMTCRDIIAFYKDLVVGTGETASQASMIDVNTEKRIARIMRRKSFAELKPELMRDRIEETLPAMATLAIQLGRVIGQLRAWNQEMRDEAFAEDRELFAATFRRLYCSAGS